MLPSATTLGAGCCLRACLSRGCGARSAACPRRRTTAACAGRETAGGSPAGCQRNRRTPGAAPAGRAACELASRCLSLPASRLVVIRVGRVDIGEFPQQSFMEHTGAGAVLTDVVSLVRDDDHRPVASLLEQLAPAFFVEARVADRDDFVDQEAVKLDGHRD